MQHTKGLTFIEYYCKTAKEGMEGFLIILISPLLVITGILGLPFYILGLLINKCREEKC